jgi:hypothetical protein
VEREDEAENRMRGRVRARDRQEGACEKEKR